MRPIKIVVIQGVTETSSSFVRTALSALKIVSEFFEENLNIITSRSYDIFVLYHFIFSETSRFLVR